MPGSLGSGTKQMKWSTVAASSNMCNYLEHAPNEYFG